MRENEGEEVWKGLQQIEVQWKKKFICSFFRCLLLLLLFVVVVVVAVVVVATRSFLVEQRTVHLRVFMFSCFHVFMFLMLNLCLPRNGAVKARIRVHQHRRQTNIGFLDPSCEQTSIRNCYSMGNLVGAREQYSHTSRLSNGQKSKLLHLYLLGHSKIMTCTNLAPVVIFAFLLPLSLAIFPLHSRKELKDALDICISSDPTGHDCHHNGSHISEWDTSQVTDFNSLFSNMREFNANIGLWDTSRVKGTWNTFQNAKAFNQDIGRWNVGSVVNFAWTFQGADSFNANISEWDVQSGKYFGGMFRFAKNFNAPIGEWDMSSSVDTTIMFEGASEFDQNIGNWDVSRVGRMKQMFSGATEFNQDIGKWNVEYAKELQGMFSGAASFSQDLGEWKISSDGLQKSADMFAGATSFCERYAPPGIVVRKGLKGEDGACCSDCPPSLFQPQSRKELKDALDICISSDPTGHDCHHNGSHISEWDTSQVTDFNFLFSHMKEFNGDISKWETYRVKSFGQTFRDARSFNIDIGKWNLSSAESLHLTFGYATSFNQDISNWCTSKVTIMRGTFSAAYVFNKNIAKWDTSRVTTMDSMFHKTYEFDGDIRKWNVSNVVDMKGMFSIAKKFNQNIGKWDTSRVTNMNKMFEKALAFRQNLRCWSVSSVYTATDMFYDAESFCHRYTPRFNFNRSSCFHCQCCIKLCSESDNITCTNENTNPSSKTTVVMGNEMGCHCEVFIDVSGPQELYGSRYCALNYFYGALAMNATGTEKLVIENVSGCAPGCTLASFGEDLEHQGCFQKTFIQRPITSLDPATDSASPATSTSVAPSANPSPKTTVVMGSEMGCHCEVFIDVSGPQELYGSRYCALNYFYGALAMNATGTEKLVIENVSGCAPGCTLASFGEDLEHQGCFQKTFTQRPITSLDPATDSASPATSTSITRTPQNPEKEGDNDKMQCKCNKSTYLGSNLTVCERNHVEGHVDWSYCYTKAQAQNECARIGKELCRQEDVTPSCKYGWTQNKGIGYWFEGIFEGCGQKHGKHWYTDVANPKFSGAHCCCPACSSHVSTTSRVVSTTLPMETTPDDESHPCYTIHHLDYRTLYLPNDSICRSRGKDCKCVQGQAELDACVCPKETSTSQSTSTRISVAPTTTTRLQTTTIRKDGYTSDIYTSPKPTHNHEFLKNISSRKICAILECWCRVIHGVSEDDRTEISSIQCMGEYATCCTNASDDNNICCTLLNDRRDENSEKTQVHAINTLNANEFNKRANKTSLELLLTIENLNASLFVSPNGNNDWFVSIASYLSTEISDTMLEGLPDVNVSVRATVSNNTGTSEGRNCKIENCSMDILLNFSVNKQDNDFVQSVLSDVHAINESATSAVSTNFLALPLFSMYTPRLVSMDWVCISCINVTVSGVENVPGLMFFLRQDGRKSRVFYVQERTTLVVPFTIDATRTWSVELHELDESGSCTPFPNGETREYNINIICAPVGDSAPLPEYNIKQFDDKDAEMTLDDIIIVISSVIGSVLLLIVFVVIYICRWRRRMRNSIHRLEAWVHENYDDSFSKYAAVPSTLRIKPTWSTSDFRKQSVLISWLCPDDCKYLVKSVVVDYAITHISKSSHEDSAYTIQPMQLMKAEDAIEGAEFSDRFVRWVCEISLNSPCAHRNTKIVIRRFQIKYRRRLLLPRLVDENDGFGWKIQWKDAGKDFAVSDDGFFDSADLQVPWVCSKNSRRISKSSTNRRRRMSLHHGGGTLHSTDAPFAIKPARDMDRAHVKLSSNGHKSRQRSRHKRQKVIPLSIEYDAYISTSGKDDFSSKAAKILSMNLKEMYGIKCVSGDSLRYKSEVEKHEIIATTIKSCQFYVCLLDTHFLKSAQKLKELYLAESFGSNIIPVLLGENVFADDESESMLGVKYTISGLDFVCADLKALQIDPIALHNMRDDVWDSMQCYNNKCKNSRQMYREISAPTLKDIKKDDLHSYLTEAASEFCRDSGVTVGTKLSSRMSNKIARFTDRLWRTALHNRSTGNVKFIGMNSDDSGKHTDDAVSFNTFRTLIGPIRRHLSKMKKVVEKSKEKLQKKTIKKMKYSKARITDPTLARSSRKGGRYEKRKKDTQQVTKAQFHSV